MSAVSAALRRSSSATGGQFDDTRHGRDRNEAYLDFLDRHVLASDRDIIFTDRHTVSDGTDLACTLGRLASDRRPDAVFANSDEVAIGLIGGLTASGIRVPDDIAVVGYDDQPMAPYLQVPLTTIRQPVAAMAQAAVHRLLSGLGTRTDLPPNPDPDAELTPRLVVRDSA